MDGWAVVCGDVILFEVACINHQMSTQTRLLQPSTALGRENALGHRTALQTQQFLRLYDEHFGRVYNYFRYRCGDASTADDLAAATFERVLHHLEDFDAERAPFGAWLFAIARNVVNNYLRAERQCDWLPIEACGEHPDHAATPEEHCIRGEDQAELLAALTGLSERQRDLLGLKFAAGLTNRRIAEITGLSEENVGVILFRALHRLRELLRNGN